MNNFLNSLRYYARQSIVHIDFPLLMIAFAILAIGVMTVHSATFDGVDRSWSQATHAGLAFILMWFIARMPPQKLMSIAVPLYVLGIILLIACWPGISSTMKQS
ncbi:MAG: rodA [Proteobacteria bacterium]|nr:rodA [Pseudomonadota bacterium]